MGYYSKRGFTLVELSIVLVIIGLLIGGILVAQSMISTTRVQTYVKSFQQYEIAVTNFQTNYRQLPGDSRSFIPAGDGNNIIDQNNMGSCNGAYADDESYYVWAHLSQARMLKEQYRAYRPSSSAMYACSGSDDFNFGAPASIGVVIPPFSKNTKSGLWLATNYDEEKFTVHFTNAYTETTMPGGDLIALDAKLDNGNAANGDFTSADMDLYDICTSSSENCAYSYFPKTSNPFNGNLKNWGWSFNII